MADHGKPNASISNPYTPQSRDAESPSSWTEPSKARKAHEVETSEEDLGRLNYLWILISCGYMVSWTSIGTSRSCIRTGMRFVYDEHRCDK